MRFFLLLLCLLTIPAFPQSLIRTPYQHLHPVYDELGRIQPGVFEAGIPDSTGYALWLKGLVDSTGNEIIPPRYMDLSYCNDVCIAKGESRTAIYFLKTGQVEFLEGEDSEARFDWNNPFTSDIFIKVNGSAGLYDRNGTLVLAPGPFTELSYGPGSGNNVRRDVLVALTDAGYGLIRRDGTPLTPMQYEEISYWSEGCIAVKQGDHWGCLNAAGKLLLPVIYDRINPVHNGMAVVYRGNSVFVTDTTGNMIVAPGQYDLISSYDFLDPGNAGYFTVAKGPYEGILDREGKELIAPAKYETVLSLQANLFMFKIPGQELYGLMDSHGKEILPPEYSYPYLFEDEWKGRPACIETSIGDQKFHFTPEGQRVMLPPYDNGYAEVSRNTGAYAPGLNPEAYVSLTHRWDTFDDGLAKVACVKDGQPLVGYCDSTGREVVPCQYRKAGNWRMGCAPVMDMQGRWLLAGRDGKILIPPGAFSWLGEMREGLAPCVNEMEKWGAVNIRGACVIPCQYDEVLTCTGGLIPVRKGLLWGLLSAEGKEVTPIRFTEIKLLPGQHTIWVREGKTWAKLQS